MTHLRSILPPSLTTKIRSLANSSYRYVTSTSDVIAISKPNPHKVTRIPGAEVLDDLSRFILCPSVLDAVYASPFYSRLDPAPTSVRLNPRLRCLRYDSSDSDSFPPHFDAVTTGEAGPGRIWKSAITVLVYLNDVKGGGRTIFRSQDVTGCHEPPLDCHAVVPTRGSVLLFEHDLMHEGEGGGSRKEILRTDVQFLFESEEGGGRKGEEGLENKADCPSTAVKTVRDFANDLDWSELRGAVPETVEGFCQPGRDVMMNIVEAIVGDGGRDFVDSVFDEFHKI